MHHNGLCIRLYSVLLILYLFATLPLPVKQLIQLFIFSHLQKFEVKETTNKIHIHRLVPRTSQGKIEVELHGTSASKSNIFRDKSDGVPSLLVPCGPHHDGVTTDGHEQVLIEESDYIPTEVHEDILARMIQSHKTGDFCLFGEKVCMG